MDPGNLIKSIIEKIKLWYKNWFSKKKKNEKINSNIKKQESIEKKKKIYKDGLMIIDDNKNSTIGTIYPKISSKNILLLKKKSTVLKQKIATNDLENIKDIDDIINLLNDDIYANQFYEINNILNNSSTKNVSILKEEIGQIIDKKLDSYEIKIIEKAYKEYDKVDYIIVTTLIIDDIIKEITQLEEDFKKNKYSKIQFEKKIKSINEKINKLEEINNQKEVQEEINRLKNDFYTKKKDKYDLLYNDEIFINLKTRCDNLLEKVIQKEEIKIKQEKQIKEEIETKKEMEKQEKLRKQEKEEHLQIEKENILKRFIDMQIAHKIILLREKMRKKITNNNELIINTLQYYDEFITGERNTFNFERNQIKTEVVKLYNDINNAICTIQKKEFIPLEHINVKLELITEKTIENQGILNYLIEKKTNYEISDTEYSKATTSKLTSILKKEKDKENNPKEDNKPKILKKEFDTRGSNVKNTEK